jgi:WD40 repeat protein
MGPTRRLLYSYYTGTLHLLESRDGKLVEVRTRDLWSSVLHMLAADLDGDGQDELVGYTKDARLFVLNGTDLSDIWNTPIARYKAITALTVGIVDPSRGPEIVFIADGLLRVFSALEDREQWKSSVTFLDTDIELGDVDGDGRNELVMNTGNVYDAYYRNLEWGSNLETGFGVSIVLFDIDSDGKPEVIGTGSDGLVRIWDVDERRMKFN